MEQCVVVTANEVQGAAVDPGDDQCSSVEPGVNVAGSEPGGAGAYGEARTAEILALHRKQVAHDLCGIRRERRGEQLSGETFAGELAGHQYLRSVINCRQQS